MDGKVTIVATGNIHICDNIEYKDSSSLLGLVALGKYDSSGNLISGGDIFFGDPRFGTMYVLSGMMFAAKDFLFNTDAVSSCDQPNPRRDLRSTAVLPRWARFRLSGTGTPSTAAWTQPRPEPAKYNPTTGQWADAETGTVLTTTEIGTLRHYQMIVNYDDRVRSQATQPPGLPRGSGKDFCRLLKLGRAVNTKPNSIPNPASNPNILSK